MKRVMMWLGGLFLVCVLIFVGLLVVLPMLLDPNDYKDKITELVYDKSGYQLEIPGDIQLQITPGLDVLFSLGRIEVQSGPAFPDTPLLSSEEARVDLSLMPLLREKRLAIQGVSLHGVYCNLIRNKDGKENWKVSSVAGDPSDAQDKTAPESAPPAEGKTTQVPVVELGALDVSRVSVRFEDQQAGKRYELKDFSVRTGPVREGQPFHLQSQFSLQSSAESNAVLSVVSSLESDVTLDLGAKTIALNALQQKSTIKGFGVQEVELQLAADAFLDLDGKKIRIDTFTLNSGEMSLKGKMALTDFDDPAFQGSLQIPEFSLRDFLEQNKISQPAWKDDSALRQVGFSCGFSGNKKKIDVSDLKLDLDGAKANGSFTLTDPAHPAYDFRMHVDRLDLDRYASEPPQGGAPTTPEGKEQEKQGQQKVHDKQVAMQPLFPVETMRKLQFKLGLDVDSMKVSGAELSRVKLAARGQDGLIELNPFGAQLYDGSISAEGVLDVRGDRPQLQVKKDLDHVQIGPLLLDMTGKEEVTGGANLSLQLTSSGNSREELIRGANGKMNMVFEDGVIKKLHILQVVRQAKALYDKEAPVQTAADEPTGFARITGSGLIREGVFYNKDLQAKSDLLKVTGSGKVDFVEEYVDYLLNVTLLRGLDRNEKTGKADYANLVVPYRIKGEFANLQEEADVAGLIKATAKSLLVNELQKQLNKQTEDGAKTQEGAKTEEGEKKDSTQQLLEKGLKGLFGN